MRTRRSIVSTCAISIFLLVLGVAAPGLAQDVVVAFGDSITHGLGDGAVSCSGSSGGYPPRLRTSLANQGTDIEIRTFGICGELTSSGVTRIDSVLSGNADADVILIMEGTNDLSNNSISTQSMRFNLNEMVSKAQTAGLEPVLASPVPRAPEAGSNARTGFLTSLLIQDTADDDIVFANPYDSLINVSNLYDNFYSDPFHPNGFGYGLLADVFIEPTRTALQRIQVGPCQAGAETLCLSNGRFQVEVAWAAEGESGTGQAVPLSGDTGFYWFFNEENLELVVKVLDGRTINGHFWVFYGALSDVEYRITVTDTVTGERRFYDNPEGTQASNGDTEAFAEAAPDGARLRAVVSSEAAWQGGLVALPAQSKTVGVKQGQAQAGPKTDCESAPETLCLQQDRFSVSVAWEDFEGVTGSGTAVVLSQETGYFWFFDGDNVELVVKILDGRSFNDNYWVFYGSLSNVSYDITITDTTNDRVVVYSNPLEQFGSDSDVEAFPDP